MRHLLLIALFLAAQNIFAQQDTLKFRVSLKDKSATKYSLERPQEFLSQKAIDRRTRQCLPIDSTDLPVCAAYVKAVKRCGVRVLVTGKWDNFVTISCNNPKLVDKIKALPFVKGGAGLAVAGRSGARPQERLARQQELRERQLLWRGFPPD
jgi:hypothetical protein